MTAPDRTRFLYGAGPSTPGVPADATARAVTGMSIGAIKSWQEMRERVWTMALDEYDEQYQADIVVEAAAAPVWQTADVSFELTFVFEPERDSPYETPIFTYGVEYKSGDPMFLSVMVKEWKKDEQGVNGCTLLVGAHAPGATKLTRFTGILHLNFQGYGSPRSDEESDE